MQCYWLTPNKMLFGINYYLSDYVFMAPQTLITWPLT